MSTQRVEHTLAMSHTRNKEKNRPSYNPPNYVNVADALLDKGRLDEAISYYQTALQLKADLPEAHSNMGVAFQHQGNLDKAISCYKKAVQLKPDYVEAYYNMGTAFQAQKNLDEAVACYKKAVRLKPLQPDLARLYNNMGIIFQAQENLDEAISCYEKAVQLRPDNATAYFNMGVACEDQGCTNKAISCYQKAVRSRPDYPEAYYNMGVVFQAQKNLDEAISCYEKAIQSRPDYPEAYYNMGVVFQAQKNLDEAISCYKKAVQSNPHYAEAYNNMGVVLQGQGKSHAAISCYQKAVQLRPDYAEAYNNMGVVLQEQGKSHAAISCYQKAVQLRPDYAEAYNNMGVVLQEQGKSHAAISCYQKVLQINPDSTEAYHNLGVAFQSQEGSAQAISCFEKVLQLNPGVAKTYSNLLHLLQLTCAWQELEYVKARLNEFTERALDRGTKPGEQPFVTVTTYADPARNLAVARLWSADTSRRMFGLKIPLSSAQSRHGKTKISVGYLSNDFCDHPTAHLILSLFGLHDRSEFEISCYSYGKDDKSRYRTRIEQDCDRFVDIRNLSHADSARRICEDHIDILVDLKGYTTGNRLPICTLRPAPIQASYLGFPGTTGADFFDYIITDKIVTPEDHTPYYTECFVYLPHCYQINDYMQQISDKGWKRKDFGLPEAGFVFCSFNQGYKIDPVMFNTWMSILAQVPNSVLWLQGGNKSAEKNLRKEAEVRGTNPERLVFAEKLPKDEHLGRLALADLALDTRIVNGHTTTSDALWAGVPVITLIGSHFASRVSSSILTAIGLPEMIVCSLDDYEALAVRLAHNPEKLKALRQKLGENRLTEPLFDTPRFVRNLEEAYKEMWKIFSAGEEPRQIDVFDN